MIGGFAGIVPHRRSEIVELGGWSLLSGTLATMMTGAVIGVIS
jgi:CNT family concentrative nucleoside transporter